MNPISRIDSLNSHAPDHSAGRRPEQAEALNQPAHAGRSPRARWGVIGLGMLLLAALGGLFAAGLLPRLQHTEALNAAAAAKANATPVVQTAVAKLRRATPSGSCPAIACRCTRRRSSPALPAT